MRRRRQGFGWPPGLGRFNEADWEEWLPGPDPGAEGYVDIDVFYASLADKPEVAAVWRWIDAHQRWTAVRVQWLKDNGYEWLDVWIDAVQAQHRKRGELRTSS